MDEHGLIPIVMVPDDAAIDAGDDARLHPEMAVERVLVALECTVRRALVARNGLDVGSDAASEAMAWAVQHRQRVMTMDNPAGYLYRVGQTAARRHRRWSVCQPQLAVEPPFSDDAEPFDGDVFAALAGLRHDQRVAVVLVHCYAYSYREVALLLGASEAAVTNHVHRGLARLRSLLGAP